MRRPRGAARAEPFEYPAQTVDMLYRAGALLPGESATLRRGRGCPTCANTGFKGRIAVYEAVAESRARTEFRSPAHR